jgi:hypothetical protein
MRRQNEWELLCAVQKKVVCSGGHPASLNLGAPFRPATLVNKLARSRRIIGICPCVPTHVLGKAWPVTELVKVALRQQGRGLEQYLGGKATLMVCLAACLEGRLCLPSRITIAPGIPDISEWPTGTEIEASTLVRWNIGRRCKGCGQDYRRGHCRGCRKL